MGSIRHRSRSRYLCFCCRDWPCMQALFCTVPTAKTKTNFLMQCPPWGSVSHPGWYPTPGSPGVRAQELCLPRDCPGRPGSLLPLVSVGLSFTEKIEVGLGWKSRDGLGLSYYRGSGCSSDSFPSLAEDQCGTTTYTHKRETRASAAMPVCAVSHTAGSGQERGELPQQPSGALCGIAASPQAGGHRLSTRAVQGTLPGSGHVDLTDSTRLFPQALGTAPLQLLCCTRHPSALFQFEREHNHVGVQHLCWRGHL